MPLEFGLKTLYGFLCVDQDDSNEEHVECNKDYRSWFVKKEILNISRDAQDNLVIKTNQDKHIGVRNNKGVLDIKVNKEEDVFSVSLEDVGDYKAAIRNNADGCFLSAHKSGKITCDKLDCDLSEQFQIFINYNFFTQGSHICNYDNFYHDLPRYLV